MTEKNPLRPHNLEDLHEATLVEISLSGLTNYDRFKKIERK